MAFEVEEKNYRGMKVIFLIIFIVLGYVIVSMMVENRNFNNDQINGTFTGTASYPGVSIFQMNITFDGMGKINGTIWNETVSESFSGEYVLSIYGNSSDITFSFPTEIGSFVFIGRYRSTITGESRFNSINGPINGTVFLSQI